MAKPLSIAAYRGRGRNVDEDRTVREIPSFYPDRACRPHVAFTRHLRSARVVQRGPARWQPGADRADGRGTQAADVPAAREDGLQGNRDRLSRRLADRLRFRA